MSSPQTQLSFFLGGQCCGGGQIDNDRSRSSFYKRDLASVLYVLDLEHVQTDFGIVPFKCKKTVK